MPSTSKIIQDLAPIYGMNTVDDPKTLKSGECLSLINAYPGNPPVPRRGCTGKLLTGSTNWRFQPPAISIEFSGVIYVIVWVYDSVNDRYELRLIDVDTTGASTNLGTATFAATPFFGMILANSSIYCSISRAIATWKTATSALTHKVIESASVVRDLNISKIAEITSLTQHSDVGPFSTNDVFGYSFQYVRRTDTAAFENGTTPAAMILPPGVEEQPKAISTFLPGVALSVEDTSKRLNITITGNNSHVIITPNATPNAIAMAQGATHLRVSRTRKQASTGAASAATRYFLTDLPLGLATVTFDDATSDATLSGETNQLITGYSDAPYGPFIEYVKGRMHILSLEGIDYFSEVVGGDGFTNLATAQAYPQLWASMFKPVGAAAYRIDLDTIDGQLATGMVRLGDDLYFFKERKIFCLYGGDPTVATPTLISDTIGCALMHTITKADVMGYFGKCILFLSNEGPAVIQEGGKLRKFSEFKIKELWPTFDTDGLYAELDTQYDWIVNNCTAAYWQNAWTIIYRTYAGVSRVWNYYFDPELATNQSAPRGPFQIELAEV